MFKISPKTVFSKPSNWNCYAIHSHFCFSFQFVLPDSKPFFKSNDFVIITFSSAMDVNRKKQFTTAFLTESNTAFSFIWNNGRSREMSMKARRQWVNLYRFKRLLNWTYFQNSIYRSKCYFLCRFLIHLSTCLSKYPV